jgi:tRNA G10  N-methylase Trm11
MKKYGFILGTNTALSLAEIFECFKKVSASYRVISNSREVLVIETDYDLNDFIGLLGGTIKIIEITDELETSKFEPDLIISMALEEIKKIPVSPKFHVGLSIYTLSGPKKVLIRAQKSMGYFYLNLKKIAKKVGINLAYLKVKSTILSAAAVLKNKLLGRSGAEFIFICGEKVSYFGKTVGVQDVDYYTKLDVGRPRRDLFSGTTPPKLAKIMVNLLGSDKYANIIDPFCGSGTFLQQMVLAGYQNIFGSDISQSAISDSEENLAWLSEELDINAPVKVKLADATDLKNIYPRTFFDGVVFEGYLGPPLREMPSKEELLSVGSELATLYNKFFTQISESLSPHSRIVAALPALRTKNGYSLLDIGSALLDSGFKVANLTSSAKYVPNEFVTERGSILYSRPGQFVYREILILEK